MHNIAQANVPRKDNPRSLESMTTAHCCPSDHNLAKPDIIGMLTDSPAANITINQMTDLANSSPSTRTFEFRDVEQPV